jgi:hypothetical protein
MTVIHQQSPKKKTKKQEKKPQSFLGLLDLKEKKLLLKKRAKQKYNIS